MSVAIITLDIINDICHEDGKIARASQRIRENNIIENINSILAWGRENKAIIIHVRVGFSDDYHDCSKISPLFKMVRDNQALKLSSWGGQFCDDLDRQSSDIEIIKQRVSAFYNTELEAILQKHNIQKLILTGVSTNNAVELTAREAHDRDYIVTVIANATESGDESAKQASLTFLANIVEVKETI